MWHEKVVQIISKSKSTHGQGKNQNNQWLIPTHQHMKWGINRNQIKQHMRDKTSIENKIPARGKDTERRELLERHQVK